MLRRCGLPLRLGVFELDDATELQERLAVLRAICVATPTLPKRIVVAEQSARR